MNKLIKKIVSIGFIAVFVMPIIASTSRSAEVSINNSDATNKVIMLDPSYQHEPFEGWGTALVWFANVTGGWPDEIKNELADELFGEEGLNLNIARYNIGGQDSPETEPYMRLGGAVPGYWNRPDEFAPPEGVSVDEDWWDPSQPNHWDWNKDANQQWWLQAAKERGANLFEAFSNSPPYFMTQSGYTSGNTDANQDNLQPDKYEEFATYLTKVVAYLKEEMGIDIRTLSPVNEPNTDYWGAKGRQEGSHWDPASQAKIIKEVSKKLEAFDLDTVVSAMDETNPGKFRTNWESYDEATKNNVGQMNVHTYGTGGRTAIRDLAKIENKRLWMSEVDLGPGGIPQDFTNIEPGLALSERITSDITNLEPKAWVLWQAIEDQVNMNADHENMNWGLIHVDFAPDDFEDLEYHKNKKFYTMGNYTKFIRPGDQFIRSDDENTLAAMDKENQEVVVVHTNQSDEEQVVDFDLSGFETVSESAQATPFVTSAEENISQKDSITVKNDRLTATVDAKSVTTFVISDVAGVDSNDSFIQSDKTYKIINKNSGLALDKANENASIVQHSNENQKDLQKWTFKKVTDGYTNQETYKIINASTGELLTNNDGKAVLAADDNHDAQLWTLSTTGTDYSFINKNSGKLLEVGGESQDEGASVGLWTATGGAHQSWYVLESLSSTVTSIDPVEVYTAMGKEPSLPEEVTANLSIGTQVKIPIDWEEIDADRYANLGEFTVNGEVDGSDVEAIAKVRVTRQQVSNLALEAEVSASFTGQWDDVNHINDGDLSNNRWTNWDSEEWRASDWVSLDFGEKQSIVEVGFHFYDDEGGTRPPESLYLESWNGSSWEEISNTRVDVQTKDEATVSFDSAVNTSRIRVQMDAMPSTCMAIREVEVMGGDVIVPSSDASVENILVNGEELADFSSDRLTYDVKLPANRTEIPTIEVELVDPFATHEIALPDELPGEAEVHVTSEDQSVTETYTIHFTLAKLADIDKSALVEEVRLVDELNETDYTTSSWEKVMTAVNHAREVMDSRHSTQDEVDQVLITLQRAITQLEYVEDRSVNNEDSDSGEAVEEVDEDSGLKRDGESSELPDTATNQFNWSFVGFVFLVLGIAFFKGRKSTEER
ncbi:hypothetical protein J416_13129 [Gracilibacillus halophilus YIM-C55.5]|uniref:F5/8 type C domain-containing protein n=1 Tax=Gracilibacillus halophilus YIM-C55.5 TaxID=1308866 RepID=N4WS29_9BACI|nr:glycoside hydrolase [Gracilibacillus halophilus]ENH95981.1 hypothetical protein J416_13129 [Gracilibacillus halophilus YIM-C55.5]